MIKFSLHSLVYDDTTRKTPVFVRSPKLSLVGRASVINRLGIPRVVHSLLFFFPFLFSGCSPFTFKQINVKKQLRKEELLLFYLSDKPSLSLHIHTCLRPNSKSTLVSSHLDGNERGPIKPSTCIEVYFVQNTIASGDHFDLFHFLLHKCDFVPSLRTVLRTVSVLCLAFNELFYEILLSTLAGN